MSTTTRAALEQAIRDHISDEHPDTADVYLTDWAMIAAGVTKEVGITSYRTEYSASASHSLVGLCRMLLNDIEDQSGTDG